ncbi:guanine nucleotide binding protein, alpha subunit [Cantharellus anzutake]|uniref:guanine nucleotide binding protein, alpha subunit n=1 Tax=Cantharellus anzutake TaxID=1750568 RepID=UPI001906FD91|nr:guanine nucleotide binding protein, alpha subunit [Cantharellus anzutake]KAF8344326.1 guanine nucleotide binding protein, alpha subunit [Cantharellus anzutake]
MGACVSAGDRDGRARNAIIDKQIEEDSRRLRGECKILLLGSGESGKSTIVKQMKIIHQKGFTKDELMLYRPVVNKNVVESAQDVANAMIKFSLQPEVGVNRDYMMQIKDFQYDPDPSFTLPISLAEAIESFWKDPVILRLMERSNEFYLMDSADYFFSNVRRICDRNYVPTEVDVLRARAKTTGITETRFTMGQLSIHMFDVGGQRSERRKWIHCFEAVTSIIFCVAISEYDQVLLEEKAQNRMLESLVLFESVVNSRWFLSTSIILFLNKIDVFQSKLARSPLEKYFPEFKGGSDVQKATKFILWKFVGMNRAKLALYPHLTQATDTDNIRVVFAAVKETILQNALRDSGIL